MPNKSYSSGTVVDSDSLNAFNQTAYNIVGDGTNPAPTKAAARTNLGLGSIATQGSGAVAITGGTISGVAITGGSITGMTDITVADGGTGASTAAQALINLGATGRLLGIQRLNATGTYTPTAGTTRVLAILQGPGGGGGGTQATSASQFAQGGGGGAGGTAIKFMTSGFSGATYTQGAAGAAGGINQAGAAGGVSTFNGLTANGGGGGALGLTITSTATIAFFINDAGAGLGGTATGGDVNISGGNSTPAFMSNVSAGNKSGDGGSSQYGIGGRGVFGTSGGAAGSGAGVGGSGGSVINSVAGAAGAAGTAGFLLIYEYA